MNIYHKINEIVKASALLSALKLKYSQKRWRNKNKHNRTKAHNTFNHNSVKVGKGTYGELDIRHFGNPLEKIQIGNYCSIGPDCVFILGGGHNTNRLSTYPFLLYYGKRENESIVKGPIIIDDDVWIGYGATILSGVHIGQGAVVAAGAVVTENVDPYSIVGGIPARRIRYRFPEEIRNYLVTLDYGAIDEHTIEDHIDSLARSIDNLSIEEVREEYGWFPKR